MKKFRELTYKAKLWMESFADKPYAMTSLFILAFAESSFFPIPPDVLLIAIAIASGAAQMNLLSFILISTIGRSARFFLVGGLIYFVGPKVNHYIDKYFDKLSIAVVILLIGDFITVKYLF